MTIALPLPGNEMTPTTLATLAQLLQQTRALLAWEVVSTVRPQITVELRLRSGGVEPYLFLPAAQLEELIATITQENLIKLSEAGIDMSSELESFKNAVIDYNQQNN